MKNKSITHKLGRQIKNFDTKIWNENRVKISTQGNFYKFSQNSELKDKLLITNDKELIMLSSYDKIWGIRNKPNEIINIDHTKRDGMNLLGIVLMNIREQLKIESFND